MIIRKFCGYAAGLFLAAVFFPLANTRAAIPPAEYLLPADTLMVVTAPDFSKLRADARQSPKWLFWNDPAMKPFHDKFIGNLNDSFIGPLEADLGIKVEDFEDLPQGQLTFAITRNGWDGQGDNSPGIVFLLDARHNQDQLATNLAVLKKKWTDSGKTLRTQIIRGIPFSIVMISSNDVTGALTNVFHPRPPAQIPGQEPKPDKPGELVVGQFDSLLIAGNSVEAVEPVAAHLTGSQMPALNDDSTFSEDKMEQFHGSPLCYGWFDAKVFLGILATAQPPQPDSDTPSLIPRVDPGQMITALGLGAVRSISFAYSDSTEGAQMNFFIAVPESDQQGILKMFAPVPESSAPPAFVPAEATKFIRCRIDGQQAWKSLQDMVNNISPAAMIGLNSAIDMANANAQQRDPGFDIRKNLFENLGDDFIRYEKAPGAATVDPAGAPSIFLFKVHNGDRAIAAFNTLASLAPSEQKVPAPRAFQGHKIYSLPFPGGGMPGMPASPRFMYCATSGGYVAMTPDVSMLESYLRSAANPPKPLSGIPGLIDAAQHVGGTGNGLFGYENERETMRTAFKTLNGQSAGGLGGVINPMLLLPQTLRGSVDFSLLPDYDAVSKYFYFSVFAGSSTVNGISFKVFMPRPPGLD